MKKKIIAMIALCVLVVLCLSACSSVEYDKLDKMVHDNYSSVTVTVTTATSEDCTLTSKFIVTNIGDKSHVDYEIEQFTKVVPPYIPEAYKTVIRGSVTVKDGVIIEQDGVELNEEYTPYTNIGMNFKARYFNSVKMTETTFSADVKRPEEFLGQPNLVCSAMKVAAKFGETLQSLDVTYTSQNGASVHINYEFQK